MIWRRAALDVLADIYVTVTPEERERIAAAVAALNARLHADPLQVGESRTGGFRIAFLPLLAIVFHVSAVDHEVRVTRVTRYGK